MFFESDGEKLAAIIDMPTKPNGNGVVLLHCFTCTKHHRIMRNLAKDLCDSGFCVLRFDFPGNGESEGKIEDSTYTKMIHSVSDAVSMLKSRGMEKIGLAGHSMGAMIALLAAKDERIDAVAFIAGSSKPGRVREVFPKEAVEKAEREGIAEAFVYGRTIKLKREFLIDLEKHSVEAAVKTLSKPILIVHGSKDETINVEHAKKLYSWANQPTKLEIIDGADHLFKDEKHLEKLKEAVAKWFQSF